MPCVLTGRDHSTRKVGKEPHSSHWAEELFLSHGVIQRKVTSNKPSDGLKLSGRRCFANIYKLGFKRSTTLASSQGRRSASRELFSGSQLCCGENKL